MVREENFGYSVPLPETTNEDLAQVLRREIGSSKKYAFFSLLEAAAIPYIAETCSGKFSEPWDSTIYGGMILLEILAVGAFLYSLYTWRRASKYKSELEQMVDREGD